MIAARSLSILQELINIGVGKGAQVLNTLLKRHVVLAVPEVTEISTDTLIDALGIDKTQTLSCVQMGYRGALEGEVQLIFPAETASQMVSLIIGDDYAEEELDFIRQATLTEVGNIVINAVVGTLSNLFGFHLQYTLPAFRGGGSGDDRRAPRFGPPGGHSPGQDPIYHPRTVPGGQHGVVLLDAHLPGPGTGVGNLCRALTDRSSTTPAEGSPTSTICPSASPCSMKA